MLERNFSPLIRVRKHTPIFIYQVHRIFLETVTHKHTHTAQTTEKRIFNPLLNQDRKLPECEMALDNFPSTEITLNIKAS